MDGLLKAITAIQQFISGLTWKKLAQFVVFLLIVGSAWVSFEKREVLYNLLTQTRLTSHPKTMTLSKKTTAEIDSVVVKSDLIVGVQVLIVDFQKNIRTVIYTSTDDPMIKDIYLRYVNRGLTEYPVFNSDEANNRRIVNLINGEFECVPFKDTLGFKVIPELSPYIATTCANGIPPFYGKFSGMITIFTKKSPTPDEMDQIRTIAKSLSQMVYYNDLK